jgi:hypothetical protein
LLSKKWNKRKGRRNKSRTWTWDQAVHKKRRRKMRATPMLTARREEERKGQGCGLLRIRFNRKRKEEIKTIHSS